MMNEKRWSENRLAVMGGGRFGYILTTLFTDKCETLYLWLPDANDAERLENERTIPSGGSGRIADNVKVISGYNQFMEGGWTLFVAVQSRDMEATLEHLMNRMNRKASHVITFFSKGLLSSPLRKKLNIYTYTSYTDHLARAGFYQDVSTCAASGPSLMTEIQDQKHSFFLVGASNQVIGQYVRTLIETSYIHTEYTNHTDGMQIAGVLKNPTAVAAGIVSGMDSCGDNVLGEIISAGFREMHALGRAMGVSDEILLGRAGLADLLTTGYSDQGRNRSYGKYFVQRLSSGEERPGLISRFERFMNPQRFIEKDVSRSQYLAEGVFSLSAILEIAKGQQVEMPLYEELYQVLGRRHSPESLLRICGASKNPEKAPMPVAEKKTGLRLSSGKKFTDLLEMRVEHAISTSGLIQRITRQSTQIVSMLERRIDNIQKGLEKSSQEELLHEKSLWEAYLNQGDLQEQKVILRRIIRFYVEEISDTYTPGMRDALIHMLQPFRHMLGGFRRHSATPHVGGNIEEIRSMASRYNLFYTPTHKSHLDSVEMAFALNSLGLPLPRYAAGKILMYNPFRAWILKSLGAYAVDRKRTRNLLYLECLGQYSTMMLEAGIPGLVFPEGTRSRSGGIVSMKTGLLSTAVSAFKNSGSEILFVPVSISYETVPEDRSFARDEKEPPIRDFLTRRSNVYLDFGSLIPVSRYMKEEMPALAIGHQIQSQWEKNMRILPNHVLSRLLVENDFRLEDADILQYIEEFIITHPGNYLTRNAGEIAGQGIRRLKREKLIRESGGVIVGREQEVLNYYGNMIPGVAPMEDDAEDEMVE